MNLPLRGIRVVEMTHMIMGPSCGMFLAQLGAEVIKIEPPDGDKTRGLTGMGSGFFPVFNRGKRSVVLDLECDAGREALDRLLATADVFVDNFRDGALARSGLSYAELRERFPRLVIAAHKGFLSGPYERRPALDEVVQMMSGLAYMTGPSGRPLRIGSSATDIMGGMQGAMLTVAAIMERERTGRGRTIRVGLFETCMLMVAQHMAQYDLTGTQPPPMPERDFSWPVYDIFATADGKQIFVGVVTGKQWKVFCDAFGMPDLADDPALASQMDRINARSWTIPRFREALLSYEASELMSKLDALGLPYSPINRPSDLYDDPHASRAARLLDSVNADGRTFRAPGIAVEVDGEPLKGPADVPGLGQDTRDVLAELGYAPEAIAALWPGAR